VVKIRVFQFIFLLSSIFVSTNCYKIRNAVYKKRLVTTATAAAVLATNTRPGHPQDGCLALNAALQCPDDIIASRFGVLRDPVPLPIHHHSSRRCGRVRSHGHDSDRRVEQVSHALHAVQLYNNRNGLPYKLRDDFGGCYVVRATRCLRQIIFLRIQNHIRTRFFQLPGSEAGRAAVWPAVVQCTHNGEVILAVGADLDRLNIAHTRLLPAAQGRGTSNFRLHDFPARIAVPSLDPVTDELCRIAVTLACDRASLRRNNTLPLQLLRDVVLGAPSCSF
jgi:hypothetical protein